MRARMKLNPYDGYNYLRYGMCLDWLDRHDEAEAVFQPRRGARPQRLLRRWRTSAGIMSRSAITAAARPWLQRSLRLDWQDNAIARSYLELASANWWKKPPARMPIARRLLTCKSQNYG